MVDVATYKEGHVLKEDSVFVEAKYKCEQLNEPPVL